MNSILDTRPSLPHYRFLTGMALSIKLMVESHVKDIQDVLMSIWDTFHTKQPTEKAYHAPFYFY